MQQAIKRANLVIAVIPEQASPNIFFELGMAQALNKSLILLVSPEYGNIPSDLVGAF
jgi:predicted nucleotide-binding protein